MMKAWLKLAAILAGVALAIGAAKAAKKIDDGNPPDNGAQA